MPASVDMFGPGGEGLGGLFLGNQMGQQTLAAEAERQKAAMDMANTQSLINQRDLSTQYESAIMPDKIQAYKDAILQKNEDRSIAKFDAQGEKFGQLSQVLASMPAAARPAALQQMAQQAGIDQNNPMLRTLSQIDPENLPEAMSKFSQGFYENSDKARAEKQKRDAMLAQKQEELRSREAQVAEQVQQRREAAQQHNETLRAIAAMREGGQNSRAAAKNAAKGGGAAPTTDKAIAGLIINDPNMTDEQKLEALQRYNLNKATVGKTGSTEDIMGLPSPAERAANASKGITPSSTKGAPTQISSAADYAKLPSGATYIDPQGNKRTKK